MSSTLADLLRAATDDELGALLQRRPDLAVPIPADISQLAGRVQSRVSVARALDELDRFTLGVLDGLRYVRGAAGSPAATPSGGRGGRERTTRATGSATAPATRSTAASSAAASSAAASSAAATSAGAAGTAGAAGVVVAGPGFPGDPPGGETAPRDTAPVDTLLTLAAEAGVDSAAVRSALQTLQDLRLVYRPDLYGDDGQLRLVGALDELLGPYPVGLGRPATQLVREAYEPPPVDVVALVADPAGLRRALLAAPPEARAVLDRLAEGPPLGQASQNGALTGPVRWLVDHGLLVALGPDLVELPREVGLVLRREAGPLGPLHPQPPELGGQPRPGADAAGAGQAMEAVRQLDALIAAIGESMPPRLRQGGLGVRELRRLSKEIGIDEATGALLLEIAYCCGLIAVGPPPETAPGEPARDERWLPTPAYDAWRASPIARQWALIARTWLAMTRAPVLVGQRDDRDKVIGPLTLEVARSSAPGVRRATLGVLASQPESTAVEANSVIAWLTWRYPRRYLRPGATTAELHARAALREAATLGVTALDALTSYGRVLLAERPDAEDDDPLGIRAEPDPLVAALDPLLPAPVDHVLVQADLTVVVPGPPEPALAAELAAIADAESRGGATVYRVTPSSVRRALDAGYSAADLHGLFTRRSRTPLPQTLSYLIDDVARRHGGLRVGTAGAYLRGDDENLLSEVLADRRLAPFALRRLAPTVLATAHPPARLLAALRDAGYAPVPEDASGAVVLSRPTVARTRPGPRLPQYQFDGLEPPRLEGPRLAAVVEQIRRGDRIARAARRSPLAKPQVDADGTPITATQAHAQAMAILRQGITERKKVWVGFVDAHGSTGSRLVRPVSMGGGFLHAEDDRSQTRHTFALHRITAAALDT